MHSLQTCLSSRELALELPDELLCSWLGAQSVLQTTGGAAMRSTPQRPASSDVH